jgi:hypothetical protein
MYYRARRIAGTLGRWPLGGRPLPTARNKRLPLFPGSVKMQPCNADKKKQGLTNRSLADVQSFGVTRGVDWHYAQVCVKQTLS